MKKKGSIHVHVKHTNICITNYNMQLTSNLGDGVGGGVRLEE